MNRPRFRIVSEDGLNTKVFDLGTGDDITHLFRELSIRAECGAITATFVLTDAAIMFDCAVEEIVLSVPLTRGHHTCRSTRS